jgi:hypothetical protein
MSFVENVNLVAKAITDGAILDVNNVTKLNGIEDGATKNSPDSFLLNRANHIGTQSADTLTDGAVNATYTLVEKAKLSALSTTTPPAHVHSASEITTGNFDASRINENEDRVFVTPFEKSQLSNVEVKTNKNAPNGYAGLDANGKLAVGVVPAFNTLNVFTANSEANMLLLSTAEVGDQCVRSDLNTNNVFILQQLPPNTLSNWVQLNIAAGVASLNGHIGALNIDKTWVGLNQVDNTSDLNKPISIATQSALDLKAPLVSPTLVTPNIGVATGTSFNGITGLSITTPNMDGIASVGSSTTVALADHTHPTDTSRAPINSPALTGIPTAPTATSGTSSNQIATTAFVNSGYIAKDSPTGAAFMPSGTTAQRPSSPVNGYMRYNSDLLAMEAYVNGSWGSVGGGATGGGTDHVFNNNGYTVNFNYTIPAGMSAVTVGDANGNVTINNGATVTVSAGSRWVIL